MSDNQQTGTKGLAPNPVPQSTQAPTTPQALKQGQGDPDAYGAPVKPSVYSPHDAEALRFEPAVPTETSVLAKSPFKTPTPGAFNFGIGGSPKATTDSVRKSSVPTVVMFKKSPEGRILWPQDSTTSPPLDRPTSGTVKHPSFNVPSTPSQRPTMAVNPKSGFYLSRSKDLVRSSTPFDDTAASLATGSSLSVSGPRSLARPSNPFSESSATPPNPWNIPTASPATGSTSIGEAPNVLVRPSNPFAESSDAPSTPPGKTTASPATRSDQPASKPKRTIVKVSPAYVVSGPSTSSPIPIPSTYSRDDYNPNIPYIPTSVIPAVGNRTYVPDIAYLSRARGSSADDSRDPTNIPTATETATTPTTGVGSTESDDTTKGRNRPAALPKTWDNEWFDHPLPGPKPEWSYAMPKEEPKMSRVYRTKDNHNDPDGTEKLVFVNQDDAPYTAMGTSWAEDKQAQARFIMRRLQETDMTREQAEAEHKQYLNSQQFLNDRNIPRVQRHHSIIPDTVETVLKSTGVDKDTVNGFFDSFSSMTETIGHYSNETYQQMQALLGHLLAVFTSFWTACKTALPWLLEQVRSIQWWLLAAVVVFLVVFGVMNDWLGSLGLHQYHIPTTHALTTHSANLSPLTTILSVTLEGPHAQPAVLSANDISTPFVPTEAVETGHIDLPAGHLDTITTHQVKEPSSTSPNQQGMFMLGKAVPGIPSAVISSIKTVWSSASSVDLTSSIPNIHPSLSSWVNLSPIGHTIGSIFDQFVRWSYALVTLISNTQILAFITDLRVVIAVICVIATLGLYYFLSDRLGAVGSTVLTKAASVTDSTKKLAKSLSKTVVSTATESAWPVIMNKYIKAREAVRKGWKAVTSAVNNIPGKFTEFIFNIPYILVWALANPVISTKSFIGHSFVYVLESVWKTITFVTTCICWPFTQFLKLLNCIFETIKSVAQITRAWTKKQYASLKDNMSACGGGEWLTMRSIMSWFGWVAKWSLLLGIWTLMAFTMGLGWRDIYEGFEKVIIEVAPC